jgi:hypothetical protein
VARWKTKMSAQQVAEFEDLVGDFLHELGYSLHSEKKKTLRAALMRATYLAMFEAKDLARNRTPLRRFVRLERIEHEPDAGA